MRCGQARCHHDGPRIHARRLQYGGLHEDDVAHRHESGRTTQYFPLPGGTPSLRRNRSSRMNFWCVGSPPRS